MKKTKKIKINLNGKTLFLAKGTSVYKVIKKTKLQPNKIAIELNKKNSLKLRNIHGVKFDVLQNIWKISNDKSVNYISEFHKV